MVVLLNGKDNKSYQKNLYNIEIPKSIYHDRITKADCLKDKQDPGNSRYLSRNPCCQIWARTLLYISARSYTAVPDPDRGQIVKAAIILSKNYNPGEELTKELQEHQLY